MTLADGDTKPILTDNANRTIQGNMAIRDGHADADDADSCRTMRICAYAYASREKKSDGAKRERLTFFKRQ